MTESVESRLHRALEARDRAELERIFNEHPQEARAARSRKTSRPILYEAVEADDPVMAQIFLEGGVDVDAGNSSMTFGMTPLMIALISLKNIRLIDILLDYDANPDVRDSDGDTPLHHAVMQGRFDAAKALVLAGCDINAQSATGTTPLHRAVQVPWPELAEFLLESGARHNIRNQFQKTARAIAAELAESGLPEIFDRAAKKAVLKIGRAAVKGSAKPLQAAPKLALRKKGGRTS